MGFLSDMIGFLYTTYFRRSSTIHPLQYFLEYSWVFLYMLDVLFVENGYLQVDQLRIVVQNLPLRTF